MKRKSFVKILFAIAGLLILNGLSTQSLLIAQLSIMVSIVFIVMPIGYMLSLIPIEHRIQDMDKEFKLAEFTEMK
jgi:hypothetical protein